MHGLSDKISGKKILVTGGSGFLGSHVVEELLKRDDCEVISSNSSYCNLIKPKEVDLYLGWLKPDVIIHLAATCGGIGANQAEPGRFFYENLMMGMNLMETSRKLGVQKYVQVGTVCSYPKFCPVPFKEEDLWNGYPEDTNAPYGVAKKALLVQAQAYRQQYGFNAITLIPVNLYGPRDNFNPQTSHVIPATIKKMLEAVKEKRNSVDVWGSGTASREFLYVKDAAIAIIKATVQYDKSEPINVGTGQMIHLTNLYHIIGELTRFYGTICFKGGPDGQPQRQLDVSKAKKEFEFEAYTPLWKGLEETIKWYESTRVDQFL